MSNFDLIISTQILVAGLFGLYKPQFGFLYLACAGAWRIYAYANGAAL